MSKLKDELQKAVRKVTDFEKLKNQIDMTITSEGLRIELMESEKGTFFASGAAEPSEDGRQILVMLAHELGKLPNTVSIEGHTDAKPFAGKTQLQQLGTVGGSRQRRPPHDAGKWPRPTPGNPGTGLRGSAPAQTESSRRRFESPYLSGRSVSGQAGSAKSGPRRRRLRLRLRRSDDRVWRAGPTDPRSR